MSDEHKIVSLRGGPVSAGRRKADPALVSDVGHLLERAEAGEMKGICCVYLDPDDSVGFSISGNIVSYRTLGALRMITRHIEDSIIEEEEDEGLG
jgi:hypothetical protein